jgi:hypothetical protein
VRPVYAGINDIYEDIERQIPTAVLYSRVSDASPPESAETVICAVTGWAIHVDGSIRISSPPDETNSVTRVAGNIKNIADSSLVPPSAAPIGFSTITYGLSIPRSSRRADPPHVWPDATTNQMILRSESTGTWDPTAGYPQVLPSFSLTRPTPSVENMRLDPTPSVRNIPYSSPAETNSIAPAFIGYHV